VGSRRLRLQPAPGSADARSTPAVTSRERAPIACRIVLRAIGDALRTVVTPDGRTLGFAVWGDSDGFPILGLHGTPGCRLNRWPDEELYRRLGVCLVTHDRAGYARSDRRRGRRIVDEVEDVLLLADHLGFAQVGITGASGGGHHALACGALLPDRVVRATCTVGPARWDRQGSIRRHGWPGRIPGTSKSSGGRLRERMFCIRHSSVNWRRWRREWRSTRQQSSATST
jgi:pimeloyl-ACP methyl ester carboxylesterase